MTTNQAILQQVRGQAQAPRVLPDQSLEAEIAKLRAENAKLRADMTGGSIKVSAKGAVSVYGLGRFPVTLYQTQWIKLFGKVEAIAQFMVDHAGELASKED